MKSQFVELKSDLFLIKQIIPNEVKPVETREPVNHIMIYDRSGSMSGLIKPLCTQIIAISKNIPIGDIVTIGWFSSENEYNFILKGFEISKAKDYTILETAINNNNTTLGCTCFSDILFSAETVIKDLSMFSKKFCLTFFTDGYPVVNNYKLEEQKIFQAIEKIQGSLHTTMFIGFGNNYNKNLLGRMAESSNGILVHNSEINEYLPTVMNFSRISEALNPKIEIDCIDNNALSIFSAITTDGIILYSPDSSGKLYVNSEKDRDTIVYYISRHKPSQSTKIAGNDDQTLQGLFAAIQVLVQTVKIDLALEFAGKLGDVKIIDDINNAFTIADYVNVENYIKSAVYDKSKRYVNGHNSNYLPKADVFCGFQLFEILTKDPEAYFYPNHEKFQYEKIGISKDYDSDAPKFSYFPNAKCNFNNIVWNDTKLNLSTNSMPLWGNVTLKPIDGVTPESLGLNSVIPAFVYRRYTLIKDGIANVEKFYVSTSKETYNCLKHNNVVIDDDFEKSGIYGVQLKGLPVMNRSIAGENPSAQDLSKKAYEELKLQSKMKVLKFFLSELNPSKLVKTDQYTDEQQIFLIANGIDVDTGCFNWKTVNTKPNIDFYLAKSFEIKISGFSSLPSVNDILMKLSNPKMDRHGNIKALTNSQQMIADGIDYYNFLATKVEEVNKKISNNKSLLLTEAPESIKKLLKIETIETPLEFVDILELEIKRISQELKAVRSEIQKTKFQVILGKKWFKEFTSQVENQIIYNNVTFTFDRSDEKVYF